MTSLDGMLGRADRQRLAGRLAELRELDRLMRQPGTLAAPRREPAGLVDEDQGHQHGDTTSDQHGDTAKETPDDAGT